MIGLLALVFWLMAMFTYSPQDAAWSTSGAGQRPFVHNWMGRVGAWLADACYFGFGMSIWWLVLAAVQTWVTSLVRWMRGSHSPAAAVRSRPDPHAPQPPSPAMRRFWFWVGLALLLAPFGVYSICIAAITAAICAICCCILASCWARVPFCRTL